MDYKIPRCNRKHQGAPASYWLPADVPWSETELPPRSKAEAIRRAVRLATHSLGRPVSRRELRWWWDSQDADPLVKTAIQRRRLGTALQDTAKTDAGHYGTAGRVHAVETNYTCYGGAPARYTSGPSSHMESVLCALEDVASRLRIADEMEGIRNLERMGARIASTTVSRVIETRRGFLAGAVHRTLSDVNAAACWNRARAAGRKLRSWTKSSNLSADQHDVRKRHLDARNRDLRATRRVAEIFDPPTREINVLSVGQVGLFNLWELEQPVALACKQLGISTERPHRLVAHARRFPAFVTNPKKRLEDTGAVSLSLVDRVDAVDALIEIFAAPHASILISQAKAMLGHVLRDIPLVLELYEHADDAYIRRSLLVALGLLGYPVGLEEARIDLGDYDDVSAWVLSAVPAAGLDAKDRIR